MDVIAVKRSSSISRDGGKIRSASRLKELLAASDYVVLAVPYTPETRGYFGAPELAAMRPQSYLINIARSRVVDEDALIHALREKSIAGAGLDVARLEPVPPESPL